MRVSLVLLFCTLSLFLFYVPCSTAYKTSLEPQNTNQVDQIDEFVARRKRQIEEFYTEEEYAVASAQENGEEPGFWDRVVKVALKLFNKFIEWLNSS